MEISKTSIYVAFQILMLLDVLLCEGKSDAKEKCPSCRDIVDAFLKVRVLLSTAFSLRPSAALYTRPSFNGL